MPSCFQAAAFIVTLRPLEDSVHHYADVREGTCLGHGSVGATIHCPPQSDGVRGRGEKRLRLRCPGDATRRLLQLRWDSAKEFHTLAAEGAWNPEVLFDTFLHRVSEEVKDELAAQELPTDLNSLITLTIRIDGRHTGT